MPGEVCPAGTNAIVSLRRRRCWPTKYSGLKFRSVAEGSALKSPIAIIAPDPADLLENHLSDKS